LESIKKVINQSKKLALKDQDKLNAIVASAENFREMD